MDEQQILRDDYGKTFSPLNVFVLASEIIGAHSLWAFYFDGINRIHFLLRLGARAAGVV